MSKSLRLILFLVFLLSFFITAPILVLYTAGYRFDLSHGRIVHTAVLNIQSEPRNATVIIDDATQSDRTPAVIETILPGEHIVRLQKEGYLPWETDLSFESRQAMVLGPIVLFLDEEPIRSQSIEATLTSVHAPTNRFAYATQESSWLEIWMLDLNTSQTTLLMRLPYTATNTYELKWSTRGTYLALMENRGSLADITVTRVHDGTMVDLRTEATGVETAWWDLTDESALFVRTGSTVKHLLMESTVVETLPFPALRATTLEGNMVTISQSNNRAVLSFQDGEAASIITYLPLGDYAFEAAPAGLIALSDARHGRLLLLDPNNREQPILLNEEATRWKWNPTQDTLLYSSEYDLKRYTRASHETKTITRLSTRIDAIDWYPQGFCVLYQSGGQTVALNLHGTTILSHTTLLTEHTGLFWVDPDGQSLSLLQPIPTGWEWWTRALQN